MGLDIEKLTSLRSEGRQAVAFDDITAKTKIAIACQGGGSQTAFTAGALKALCEAQVPDEFEIVSVSGTSGGAVCAALVWYALERGEDRPWRRERSTAPPGALPLVARVEREVPATIQV